MQILVDLFKNKIGLDYNKIIKNFNVLTLIIFEKKIFLEVYSI